MSSAISFSADSLRPYVQSLPTGSRLDLFVKGVRCGHCVYKIEKALAGQVDLSDYQFSPSGDRLSLWAEKPSPFPHLMQVVRAQGFEVVPVLPSDNHELRQYKRDLKRLAVAGVSAGNIMLFSIAIYFGADGEFRRFFHQLSLALVLPVLLFSAQPIWLGFWQGLRARRFNLDLPIGFALLAAFLLSLFSYFSDQRLIYFDTIAVVTFLILSSRFVLQGFVARILQRNVIYHIPGVYQARVLRQGRSQWVSLAELKAGDVVEVERGEVVPVDGRLLSEEGILDLSVLNGEASPVRLLKQEKVFAGSSLCAGRIEILTEASGQRTRVGQLVARVLGQHKAQEEESYLWVSRFTSFVISAALLTLATFFWQGQWMEGFYRAFAIVIVACPCAVSFGIPLIRSLSGRLATQHGLILKNPAVLKKVAKVKQVFFDKTGTLTQGRVKVDPSGLASLTASQRGSVLALELCMDHPISRGFAELYRGEPLPEVQDFQYIPGLGVEGLIQGERWQIHSSQMATEKKSLSIFCEGQPLTQVSISTDLKEDLEKVFHDIEVRGLQISLLSGDEESQVRPLFDKISRQSRGVCRWGQTPEDKERVLQVFRGKGTLMIGDGINDIAALKAADVSVCMPGALEDNINLADVSLTRADLSTVSDLFRLADRVVQAERRLLWFTFAYNVLCVALAVSGWITPVVAAILMPMSSLTVLSLVLLSLSRL